jgi:2-polyprenyl-3-methyl-5-hydroxy-6-metoxy-1,4-benzoquinol methylase
MEPAMTRAGRFSPYLRKRRFDVALPFLQGRVLDVGCHDGGLASYVDPDRYIGVDINRELLAEARANHTDHTFLEVDELGAGERFDTVASLAVLEHVHDPTGWLARWSSHVADGGRVVLTTPHARWEPVHGLASRIRLTSHEAHEAHESLLDRSSLEELLAATGLQLTVYRRFLARMNQLVVAEPEGVPIDT